MPSILINENDLTKGGGSATNYNVVFIPGFMSTDTSMDAIKGTPTGAWPVVVNEDGDKEVSIEKAAKKHTPILCTSVSEFETYFGTKPLVFDDPTTGIQTVDKSYVYAKELLQLGLHVLYETVNDFGDGVTDPATPKISDIYTAMTADKIYGKLADKGEYQFKYLTSGGYPLFGDIEGASTNTATTDTASNNPTEICVLKDVFPFDYSSLTEGTEQVVQFVYQSDKTWKQFNKHADGSFVDSKFSHKFADRMTVEGETEPVYAIYKTHTEDNGEIVDTVFLYIKPSGYQFNVGDKIVVTLNSEGVVTTDDKLKFEPASKGLPESERSYFVFLTSLAQSRGDCIAFIDHVDNYPGGPSKVYEDACVALAEVDGADKATMFTPWENIACPTYGAVELMLPPSFAYLAALAKSIRTNASWLAVAGATRGQIPNLVGDSPFDDVALSNSMAESFQNRGQYAEKPISINAITNIKPFGYRIWGNRTLKNNTKEKNLTATSFLNTRNMICDISKVVYDTCRKYTFEQNNDVLWLNFKSEIEPTLNKMKTGAGLSGYKIIKDTVTEKAKLKATIKLYPLYAVEDFEVTVEMLDDEIKVS